MEHSRTLIPDIDMIRNSFRSVKKITTATGHARFDAEHDTQFGHADHWWAYRFEIYGQNTVPKHRERNTSGLEASTLIMSELPSPKFLWRRASIVYRLTENTAQNGNCDSWFHGSSTVARGKQVGKLLNP
jgi:hypothetical protein